MSAASRRFEFGLVLQAAQARRVGRGDVDRHVRGERTEFLQAQHIVGDAIGCVFVRADVDAADARPAFHARAVFSRAAARPLLLKPSRLMTARSSASRKMRGFGFPSCARGVTVPASTKPKPSAKHRFGDFGVLVESGGEADRIGEVEAERVYTQAWIIDLLQRGPVENAQCVDRQSVREFRIEPAEHGPR